ncbi:hypothetical protein Tco_0514309 [Tanacetum coccineum]
MENANPSLANIPQVLPTALRAKVIFDEKKLESRKAYLLEDKQIPSVELFDEVSFYTLFQALRWLLEEIHIKRRHEDHSRDGFKDFQTASERSRVKETLEDSTGRRH